MSHRDVTEENNVERSQRPANVAPHVFVVDDHPSVRRSLSRLLTSAGYTVEAFASAGEFQACAPARVPCCLVLDVRMPGLSGIELQEVLTAAGRRIPIVFVTGHADVPTIVRAMAGGAVDLLAKPVDETELLAAISRAVAKDAEDRSEERQSGPRASSTEITDTSTTSADGSR